MKIEPVGENGVCRFLGREYCKEAARGFRCSVIISEVQRSMRVRQSVGSRKVEEVLQQRGLNEKGSLEAVGEGGGKGDAEEGMVGELIGKQKEHKNKLKRLLRSIKSKSPDKYNLLYIRTEEAEDHSA